MNVALHPDDLAIISLCTGGGGLDLGVELAIPDARTVCMVEREGFAIATLVSAMEAGLLAAAPVWSDVRTFDGRAWRGVVDGLIGGIPCQPHSVAGRKRGSLDARDLWSDARRIIVQSRVWFVLIENVAGMLSAGDDEIAGAERIWRDLHKLGFTVEIGLFRASEVGAPHGRERIFILAVADRESDQRGGELETRGTGRRRSRSSGDHGELAGTTSRGYEHGSRRGRICAEEIHGKRIPEPCDDSARLADVRGAGLEGFEQRGPSGERNGETSSQSASQLRRASVEYAALIGRGEGQSEPVVRRGRDTAGGTDGAMADANCLKSGADGRKSDAGTDWRNNASRSGPIFPPGPGDIEGWRAILDAAPCLEPAIRRLPDGLATSRIDWLRLLGNGVVPLQAAYALRTLAHRLAGRRSAGAARLVRMMTPQHTTPKGQL